MKENFDKANRANITNIRRIRGVWRAGLTGKA